MSEQKKADIFTLDAIMKQLNITESKLLQAEDASGKKLEKFKKRIEQGK